MMKKLNKITSLALVGLLLTGCSNKKHYDAKDYIIPMTWENASTEDFRILQLSDIHFSQSDNFDKHLEIIDKTVENSNANLIVLNGDSFTYADKQVVNLLFSHINDYGIPWTFTFGNHDDQGYYADTYLPRLLASEKYSNALYVNLEDDDVNGRSNFAITLNEETEVGGEKVLTPKYAVYMLETHSYNFETFGYDNVYPDQNEWFERVTDEIKGSNADYLKGSVYMHIPTTQFDIAKDLAAKNDPSVNVKLGDCVEYGGTSLEKETTFFNIAKERGIQSISVAHEHLNDSVIEYQGVNLCYGVHATDRIYRDLNKIGGQIISVSHVDASLSFTNVYVNQDTLEVNIVHESN